MDKYNNNKKLKLDIDKIKKRNEELVGMNIVDKFPSKYKKILSLWKKEPGTMNSDGLLSYKDFTNYFIEPEKFGEININEIKQYMAIYDIRLKNDKINIGTIDSDLINLAKKIMEEKIKKMNKYVKILDKMITKATLK